MIEFSIKSCERVLAEKFGVSKSILFVPGICESCDNQNEISETLIPYVIGFGSDDIFCTSNDVNSVNGPNSPCLDTNPNPTLASVLFK